MHNDAKKQKTLKSIIVAFLAIILCASVSVPFILKADVFEKIDWTEYEMYNDDNCNTTNIDHIVISNNGSQNFIDFYGHKSKPFFEYVLSDPGAREWIEKTSFSFSLNEVFTDWHTLAGGGFLFNAKVDENGTIENGYVILYRKEQVVLYHVTNVNCKKFVVDKQSGTDVLGKGVTIVASIKRNPDNKLHDISINATANKVEFIDNEEVLFKQALENTGGAQFGPCVQWNNHNCSRMSQIHFTNVTCDIGKDPPIANFDYNVPVAEIRNPVIVIDSSRDPNTPITPLTYYWTVKKEQSDGSWVTLCENSNVPFTKYNENGVGTYETTLKVKNAYNLFSDVVTKKVKIIATPTITITPVSPTYEAGNSIQFKCGNWYNCSPETNDITISNVVSSNIFAPVIDIPGTNSLDKIDAQTLKATISFIYKDGTKSDKSIDIPPEGTKVSDETNKSKELKQTIIVYKNIASLAELKSGQSIIYTYQTKAPLSNYYVGGATKRIYETSNTATILVPTAAGNVTANSTAKISYNEHSGSFSMVGTVDNKNAITKAPICNTEFLLTGTSYGGENISNYIVVKDGKSSLVEIPYGEYSLNESSQFTTGYERIAPIAITVNDKGITINNKTTISDKGSIPFVKPILVTKINVHRTYESEGGFALDNDSIFKVTLSGTTVINGIDASNFELISDKDDSYYYNDLKDLILPIGTYNISEKEASDYISLKQITTNDYLNWERALSAKQVKGTPSASFTSDKNVTTPVVLKYVSDAYVYDEIVYENEVKIVPIIKNINGQPITEEDRNLMLVDPTYYSYPVSLTNNETQTEYIGIGTVNDGATFKYMDPGKYYISLHNNMYLDLESLKKTNSSNIEFGEENGKYYIIIPDDSASINFEEESRLHDWRGYSHLSIITSPLYSEMSTHVSFTTTVLDNNNKPVPNVTFQILKDGNPVYFEKRGPIRWYPSSENVNGATDKFTTDESGQIHIYKMPVGEYTLVQVSDKDKYYESNHIQTVVVSDKNNAGMKISVTNISTLEVPKSIDLTSLKNSIDIDESVILASKVLPSTAYKNVVYKSSDEKICTVSEDGIVTGKSVGTATITVTSSLDNKKINELKFTVNDPLNPKISDLKPQLSNIRLSVGEKYTAKVVYSPSNLKDTSVKWTSSNDKVASVSSSGEITGVTKGTATITATCNNMTTQIQVAVGEVFIPVESIVIKNRNLTLCYNNAKLSETQLEVDFKPDTATDRNISYKSSNPDIVSVDANGILTAKKLGTVTITATASSGVQDTCVVSSLPIVTNISPNITSTTMVKGTTIRISPRPTPTTASNANSLKWESLNPSIATVDNYGIVKAVKEGKTTIVITASYPGADDITAECEITVVTDVIEATNIDVSFDDKFETLSFVNPIEMEIGDSTEFFARVRPISTTNPEIEWTYSIPNIVAVGCADAEAYNKANPINKYRIAAVGKEGGEVTVTGTVVGTNIKTSFKVIVESTGTGFKFVPDKIEPLVINKAPNNTTSIAIESLNPMSVIKDITWTAEDDSIIEVTKIAGNAKVVNVTALSVGTTKLTAEVTYRRGGTFKESIDIVVESPRIDILVDGTAVDEIHIEKGQVKDFVVEPNYPKDSVNSGYSFANGSYCKIVGNTENNTANGLGFTITGVEDGTEEITFTPTDPNCPPKTIRVVVGSGIHKSINLSLDTEYVDEENGTIKLKVETENIDDEVILTSLNEDVATIDNNGIIKVLKSGKVTIQATADGITKTIDIDVTLKTSTTDPPPDETP